MVCFLVARDTRIYFSAVLTHTIEVLHGVSTELVEQDVQQARLEFTFWSLQQGNPAILAKSKLVLLIADLPCNVMHLFFLERIARTRVVGKNDNYFSFAVLSLCTILFLSVGGKTRRTEPKSEDKFEMFLGQLLQQLFLRHAPPLCKQI